MGEQTMGDVPETFGEPIRTSYVVDRELKASVIPSGRPAHMGGGSYAFDANNPNIPQNIIVCENGEMTKIAQVTREQMVGAASAPVDNGVSPPSVESVASNADDMERYYKDLDAAKKPEGPVAELTQYVPEPRVPASIREAVLPVYVTIKGSFLE